MAATIDDLESYLPANCPNPYYDTWDRHASIAFSKTKGLRNAPGENNCFLNSAVQVFWHLDVFRRSYRCLTGHVCMGNSCIFCALKVIFTQLQYSDQTSLHPDALRKALAETFANQQRFQLGHMDDAAECFENILRRIHLHIANDHSEDNCNAPHCLPHKKFAMSVCDQLVCPCGASSKPHNFQEMVHYVSANALVAQARLMQKSGDTLHPDRFGLLLRSAVAMGDIRDCPGNCGKRVQIRRTLSSCPDVVSVGLVWDSDHPSIEMTTEVARSIGTTIMLQDVFHSVMLDVKTLPKLHLVGVVCYYGKHYSTFVFHSKLKVWIYFDDATVREIGPRWEHVVEKCMRGRYQPLLLLYANPAATPVPVETAPKKRTMAEGYAASVSSYEDSDSGLDRTHESIKSMPRRSRTPNPDSHQAPDLGRRAVTPGPEWKHEPSRQSAKQDGHRRQPSFIFAMAGHGEPKVAEPMVNGSYYPERERILYGGQSNGDHNLSMHGNDEDDNYTLSTKDPYRRPSLSGLEVSNLPVTQGTGRGVDAQKKESFKRGKDKVRADVIRYQVSPQGPAGPQLPWEYQNSGSYSDNRFNGEDSVSINSDIVNPNQHRIVRPHPNHHTYENIDGMSHTPVQSGLATLPRKSAQRASDGQRSGKEGLARQSSLSNLHMKDQSKPLNKKPVPIPVSIPVPPNMDKGSEDCVDGFVPAHRPPPVPPGTRRTPPPVPPHSRQGSAGKVTEKKTKVKKSAKTGEKKKSKKVRDSDFVDDPVMYIDRGMVENILKHQGVKRQLSSASNASYTSGSSIESDSMIGKLLASRNGDGKNALSVEIPGDNISIGSYKDSGYGSSDRNSSSSTGSENINPYSVYFLSRGMIVPNSINNQYHHERNSAKMSPSPDFHRDHHAMSNGNSPCKQGTEQMDHHHQNGDIHQKHHHESVAHGRQVLHPIKERSFEDSLRSSPRQSPSNFLESSKQLSCPSPSPPEPITHAVQREAAGGNEPFLMLCHKSDELMDQCVLAETDAKLQDAQNYCNSAIGCLREAMNVKNMTHQSMVHANRKHTACMLKSRSLQLRISSRSAQDRTNLAVSSRLAVNNSDSDTSSLDGSGSVRSSSSRERLDKPVITPGHLTPGSTALPPGGHYRSNSGLSVHERQNGDLLPTHHRQGSNRSTDSGHRDISEDFPHAVVTRSNSDQFAHKGSIAHSQTDSNLSSKSMCSHSSSHPSGSQENLVDIYATLPRRKNRKPSEPSSKDPEVYQSYLNKQKSLNTNLIVEHARTSSGSSTTNSLEGRESDSGSSSGRSKLSQAEIRDLLEKNYVRRHQEQIVQKHSGSSISGSGSQQQFHQNPPPVNQPSMPSRRPSQEPVSRPPLQTSEVGRNQRPACPSGQKPMSRPYPGNKPCIPPKVVSSSRGHPPGQPSHLPPKPAPQGFGRQCLNVYDPHQQGRPLERSASQPDCQKLVDPSLASNTDRQIPISTSGGKGDLYMPSQWPGQLSAMRTNSASQPDLRGSPLLHGTEEREDPDVAELKPSVSVRALASRFETTVCVEPQTRRNPVRKQNSDVGMRQRSKSESNSSMKNPKSVLKNKKNKNARPRKSVTFCENIAQISNLESGPPGYESACKMSSRVPDDRAYYSDDEDRYTHKAGYIDSEAEELDSSNSDEGPPVGVPADQLCHLCSKRCIAPASQYCANCQFYMSRMMPSGQ